MINGHEVYCCVFTTNLVENQYYPVSEKSMQSWSKHDFIDKIYAFNGQSTDDTVEKHSSIKKVNFVTSPKWDTSEISQKEIVKQFDFALDFFNTANKDIIILIMSSDIIWSEELAKEIHGQINKLTKSNCNFFRLPFVKAPTKNVREVRANSGNSNRFSIYSAIKFNEKTKWNKILREEKIIGTQHSVGMVHNWINPMISYETWFFTKEDFLRKMQAHSEWASVRKLPIENAIQILYLNKLKKYGTRHMKYEDHPKEAQELIDILEEKHLGYSLFGNYEH